MLKTLVIGTVLSGMAVFAWGCGGPSAHRRVFQGGADVRNSRVYATGTETCWTALMRAALSLNFGVDQQDPERRSLQASRYFKEGGRTTRITLKASLQPVGEGRTTLYVTAVQATERLYARSHRRFFLWVIPLPGGGGTEASRVREGEWTVDDRQFYDAFFQTVQRELGELQKP